jgi:hypothetical protein
MAYVVRLIFFCFVKPFCLEKDEVGYAVHILVANLERTQQTYFSIGGAITSPAFWLSP